jgi:hypothetical protein
MRQYVMMFLSRVAPRVRAAVSIASADLKL